MMQTPRFRKKAFLYAFVIGVVGMAFLLVQLFIQQSAAEVKIPSGMAPFVALKSLQQREELLLSMDVGHDAAAFDAVSTLLRRGGWQDIPRCGTVPGSELRRWYDCGTVCVPTAVDLGGQLAIAMSDQHIWQLKNNPVLQDAKMDYARDDFVYAAFAEDGRFVIESYAAKPVLLTSSYANPSDQQGVILNQIAVRPNLRSVVSVRWPLPADKRAALMAAVERCQNDKIENLDPEGCLKAASKTLGIEMDVKPDAATNAVNAVIKLPTGASLPGRALVEPASLWFGVRVCKKALVPSAASPPAVP